jgi:hypothetical protein
MTPTPQEPGRTGLGPEQSDTPPDDLPDLPDVPDGDDVLPGVPGSEELGTRGGDISGPVPGDD